jgi:hypothetical protein
MSFCRRAPPTIIPLTNSQIRDKKRNRFAYSEYIGYQLLPTKKRRNLPSPENITVSFSA